jgi:putative ABC transport system permease protein
VGRFLSAEDEQHMKNVAVLGARAAEDLFPREDPVGKAVSLGRHAYLVVGFLRPQAGAVAGLPAREADRAVYLPLRTCRGRFGERILVSERGKRRAEQVAVSRLLVTVPDPAQASGVRQVIEDLLGRGHADKDWEVQGPVP